MSDTTHKSPGSGVSSTAEIISHQIDAGSHVGLEALPFIPSPALLWRSLSFWIWAAFIVLILAAVPHIIVDYWFFDSLHKTSIFWTNFNAQLALFAITWLAFWLDDYLPIRAYAVSPTLKKAAFHMGMWSGLFAGWTFSRDWQQWLLLFHAVPFGKSDPVFGHDFGFYVFQLPAIRIFLAILVAGGLDMAVSFLIGRYDQLRSHGLLDRQDLSFWAKCGMLVTPGLNFALTVFGISVVAETFFTRYSLLLKDNESSGVRTGAQYIDLNGIFSTLNLINVSTLIEFGLMLSFGFVLYRISKHYEPIVQGGIEKREVPVADLEVRRPFRIGLALLAVDLLFFTGVVLKLHVFVSPNEPNIQVPYIQRHMDATLEGYHLDHVQTVEWVPPKDKAPSKNLIDSKTIENAPILPSWQSYLEEPPDIQHYERLALDKDKLVFGPMLQVYRQEQQLRPYYSFTSVDGVRYKVNGERKMYVSAVRELPSLAFVGPKEWLRYWGSAALMFTHGYGLVMSPIHETDEEGRPKYALYDIPPKADNPMFTDVQPRIYFGEGMKDDYILTNIRHLKELDYATPQFRQTYEYPPDAPDGIPMSGVFKRLIFALHTKDLTAFLFSSFIDHDRTRVHIYRTPMRRAARIAPFLFLDSNNFAFISEKRVLWMINALTTTEMYPYSFHEVLGDKADERAVEPHPERIINYAEDSVKITMDAFTGEIHFYKISNDPIITAWADVYPDLFDSDDKMPDSVRSQLNYPLQWFHIQFDDIYKRYHMKHPIEFYNTEDLWDDADDIHGSIGKGYAEFGSGDQSTFSYEGFNELIDPADLPAGVNIGAPGDLQYTMLMPFTPEGARNLRSLIMAYQDPPNYGKLVNLRIPQGEFVPGPEQADTIIDTDAQLNQQIGLWVRHGSEVVRGQTLIVPVKGDLMYIEPLWISSLNNHIPEVKIYSVVYHGRCTMSTNLKKAISLIDVPEAVEEKANQLPWFEEAQKEGK